MPVESIESEILSPEDLRRIDAELTKLQAAIEENRNEIREMARLVAAWRGFLDRHKPAGDSPSLSVDFMIRPWDARPEKRGPFTWKRLGQHFALPEGHGVVVVFLPAILIALEKSRTSRNLSGPVPEVRLLDQVVYITGHEVLHHALKGSGLSYNQEHQAIAKIFDWIWIRRVPRLQQDQAGDFPTARIGK